MYNNKYPPAICGWFFIFGYNPTLYRLRTSASFIGLPAMQILLATHKWVLFKHCNLLRYWIFFNTLKSCDILYFFVFFKLFPALKKILCKLYLSHTS